MDGPHCLGQPIAFVASRPPAPRLLKFFGAGLVPACRCFAMSSTEYLHRLAQLEARYDLAVPPHALELARWGTLARYRARRAAVQSKFFDRFAREAQRAIQARRAVRVRSNRDHSLDALANYLRAARRQGLAWLSRV